MNSCYFFFNGPATTEICTLPPPDALPICRGGPALQPPRPPPRGGSPDRDLPPLAGLLPRARRADLAGHHHQPTSLARRSEEHTSELQSRQYLVCRLLLEKKK